MRVALLACVAAVAIGVVAIAGCKDETPVPVSQCSEVVRHTKSILRDGAPSDAEMLATCKKGNDAQRGCVMAANSVASLLRCAK